MWITHVYFKSNKTAREGGAKLRGAYESAQGHLRGLVELRPAARQKAPCGHILSQLLLFVSQFLMQLLKWGRAGWSSGSVRDVCSGGARFECRPDWDFRGFRQSFQANAAYSLH
jgi:hypothetical protein